MQRIMLSCAVSLIAAPLFSQDQTYPPGYDTTDGGSFNGNFGQYADGRTQVMYGDLYGNTTVFSWTGMQWRRSTTKVDPNEERKYSSLVVKLGTWDLVTTDAWASNIGPSPTTVYSGNFTLPEVTGLPVSTPSPWGLGSTAGDLQLKFTAPYLFASSEGLTVDMTFTGGVMKNGGQFTPYYLDGILDCNMSVGGSNGNKGDANCIASGILQNWLHADRMPAAKSGPIFRTQIYEYGPAAEANKLHFGVLGTVPLAVPAKFLNSCNQLFLDLNAPIITYPYVTDAAGDYFSDFLTNPYIPGIVGREIWSQAAVEINGNVELTRAGSATFPAVSTATPVSISQRLYATHGGNTLGGIGFHLGWGPGDDHIPCMKMIL